MCLLVLAEQSGCPMQGNVLPGFITFLTLTVQFQGFSPVSDWKEVQKPADCKAGDNHYA